MVKPLIQNIYVSGELKLTACPKFLYEVSLYKIWKDRSESHGSKFFASEQPLKFEEIVSVRIEDYRLVKYIAWLSAPLDYMLSNGFELYDENDRKRRQQQSSSKRKRR